MPLARGERSSPSTPSAAVRREQLVRQRACRSPCRSGSRDAWIASGSTTSIRSAIRLSLGSRIASALNAGSSALDCSVARDRADHRLGIDRFAARAGDRAPPSSVPASPRSGRTGRCRPAPAARARRGRALGGRATTGAEKSRLIDSSGGSVDILERHALPRLVEDDQPLGRDLRAALARRSARSAAGSASAAWPAGPGVGSSCCSRCSVAVFAAAIMLQPRADLRRARLAVPDPERRQVDAAARPPAP